MNLATALTFAGVPLYMIGLVLDLTDKVEPHFYYGLYATSSWTLFVSTVLSADRVGSAIWGLYAAWNTYQWWRHRRKGGWKRAARELGAKSKARVEALVEQMTPSPIPSPVGGGA